MPEGSHAASAGAAAAAPAPESSGERIELHDVSKVFRSTGGVETTALAGMSMTIEPGTISCIIGPSGCGKTTLLNLVAGFESPSTGEVLAGGVPVRGAGVDRVAIFQDVQGSLMPWLTAQQNVEFGLRLAGLPREQRRSRAQEALAMVGLDHEGSKYVAELSGGMQQRVQIARGLVLRPGALLMDEPFGALDYLTRSTLQAQLQDLHAQTGVTVLFVTHDISEAAVLADDIYAMGRGGVLARRLEMTSPRPRTTTDEEVVQAVEELTALILASTFPGPSQARFGEREAAR